MIDKSGFEKWVKATGDDPQHGGYCTLPGLRPQEFAVAIDAGPVTVDEGHGIAADRAIRWRPLGNEWKKIRKLVIVFVHGFLPFPLFDLQLNGLFRALPTGNPDECQLAIDNRRRHGTDRMAVRQLLAILRGDIHFPIGKAVLHAQLLPQTLGGWTGSATGRHKQGNIWHTTFEISPNLLRWSDLSTH